MAETTASESVAMEYSALSKKHPGKPMKSPGRTMFRTCRRPSWRTR
jgi:hypothetical protein